MPAFKDIWALATQAMSAFRDILGPFAPRCSSKSPAKTSPFLLLINPLNHIIPVRILARPAKLYPAFISAKGPAMTRAKERSGSLLEGRCRLLDAHKKFSKKMSKKIVEKCRNLSKKKLVEKCRKM